MAADTQCVVAGGGPAGIVLGLLLARAGVMVTVLEKHADFLRDFRGDTVHCLDDPALGRAGAGCGFSCPSPEQTGQFPAARRIGDSVVLADFGRLKAPYNYVAMVPQWDLLNFLVEAARQEPTFTLLMNTEATDLLTDASGAVVGVTYGTRDPLTGSVVGSGEPRLL